MDHTIPLHTNNNKKVVFVFAFCASSFFNIILFSSIGGSLMIRFIWALTGLATVLFQTVELRNYFNTKKKIRHAHLTIYLVCTFGSIAGTLGAGYSHVEKTKLKNIDQTVKIEIIDQELNDIEIASKDNTEIAINNVMMNNTNINQWALIRLMKEKDKIKNNNFKKYDVISKLKNEKAELMKSQSEIVNSLIGLSKLFGVKESAIAFIFLIFVAVMIELMIFESATFTGKLFNKLPRFKPIKFKNKKSDQPKKLKLTKLMKEVNSGQTLLQIQKVG